MNPVSRAAGAAVLFTLALGCADKPPDSVRVEGNVVAVTSAPPSASRVAPRDFAAIGTWLESLWVAPAIAQSCGAAVQGVLACLATQGAGPTFGGTCARVRSNCLFEVDIVLAAPGDSLFLFFCADSDGNGSCEPTEISAPYLNFDRVGNFCNGDVLRVTDVSIDFASQICSGSPASVVADGCAPPDPTEGAPTATARPGEPTQPPGPLPTLAPGVTPSPPPPPTQTSPPGVTPPTPTRTPLPPGPTPTPTCVPDGDGCNFPSQCCAAPNALCDDNQCEACRPEGANCPGDPPLECCSSSNTCQGGTCAPCGGPGALCAADNECCGQAFCDGGSCLACLTLGETPCGATPCCPGQGVCFDSLCQFCVLPGDGCAVSADCCAFGAGQDCRGGACSACADVGAPCAVDADCCERPNSDLVCDPVSFDCQPTV